MDNALLSLPGAERERGLGPGAGAEPGAEPGPVLEPGPVFEPRAEREPAPEREPAQVFEPKITRQQLHNWLDAVIDKYSDHDYVYCRLVNQVEHVLPAALESAVALQLMREERKKNFLNNREEFSTRFLGKNQYYYILLCHLQF